jgi:hypothetical protein
MDDDRDADDAVAGLDGKNGWKVSYGGVGQWRGVWHFAVRAGQ